MKTLFADPSMNQPNENAVVTGLAADDAVTDEEIAAFAAGDMSAVTEDTPADETERFALPRRVLLAALKQSKVREKLVLLRECEADWQPLQSALPSPLPAQEAALRKSLRRAAHKAGFGDTWSEAENADETTAELDVPNAAQEAAALRNAGGGRWVTNAAQSTLAALQSVQNAVQSVPLLLGREHILRLPCFAPALAADAPSYDAFADSRKEVITTGDGVRIEFQQLPGSGNRLRVLVDTTLLPAPPDESKPRVSYNVAFLTLTEGEAAPVSAGNADRHILVVSLNERGVGFADFAVSSASSANPEAAPKTLPAPRTGNCRLVSATLSYLPAA